MGHKYTIKLYPKAYRDLDGIYQYIYEHIQMPQYAEHGWASLMLSI